MRRFYLAFKKQDALRLELSWTHYRTLLRLKDEQARLWYMQEAQQHAWSFIEDHQKQSFSKGATFEKLKLTNIDLTP